MCSVTSFLLNKIMNNWLFRLGDLAGHIPNDGHAELTTLRKQLAVCVTSDETQVFKERENFRKHGRTNCTHKSCKVFKRNVW